MKRYESYKDSGVKWLGEIPEHWELKRLASYFEERREKVSDKDYKPLSVTKNGIMPQLETAAKSNDGDNRKLVKQGDFVINSRSDRKGSSGVSPLNGSVSLINIVLEPSNVEPKFCNYLLKSYSFIEEYYRVGRGIVADLWTTRFDEMKLIMLGIPPIEEQQVIAEFLDEKTAKVDQAIAIKEKEIDLLKERRQILIQELVTGKKVWDGNQWTKPTKTKNSGVDWIGEIPEDWKVEKFKRIFFEKRKETNITLPCGAISYGNVVYKADEKILESTKSTYQVLNNGEFLLNPLNMNYDLVSLRIALSDKDVVVSSGYIIFKNSILIDKNYYKWFLYIFDILHLKTLGAGVRQTINFNQIGNSMIIIPSLEHQKIISSYILRFEELIQKAITLKRQEIEKLKEYKTVLIDNVVTGKVRVT